MRYARWTAVIMIVVPAFAFAQSVCTPLSRGASGPNVVALQEFLASAYSNFPTPTGYFGATTEAAVKQWQKENNIVSSGSPATTGWGAVGKRTIAAMKLCLSGPASSVSKTSSTTPTAKTDYSPLIQALLAQIALLQKQMATIATSSSGIQPATTSTIAPSVAGNIPGNSCGWNGQTIQSGSSIVAYRWQSVPAASLCVSESRQCVDGTLGGSYQYPACAVNTAAPVIAVTSTPVTSSVISCTWNGQTIQDGSPVTAYQSSSVVYGSQCVSETRICASGQLSGSYQSASCATAAAASCALNGSTVQDGTSITAYQTPSVSSGSSCSPETRTCSNGTLSGSYQYSSCVVGAAAQCMFNGLVVSQGGSAIAYQTASVPYGSTCASQNRTCTNGILSGSYQYSVCAISLPVSCTFNGATVPDGASTVAYQTASVPYGSTCASQNRTCTNGTLSGSYQNASCAVAAGASCTFNGESIPSGTAVAAFQSSVVSSGNSCTPQTRTCTNGVLSGSSAYSNSTCSVQSSNASLPNMFIPVTYNGTLIHLQGWFASPTGVSPYPVVILAHGCNGLNPDGASSDWNHLNAWATLFRQWGYATLLVDSFTARGAPDGICTDSSSIMPAARAIDLYSAATVLAKTSGISPSKIGIFGSSHGANVVGMTVRNDPANDPYGSTAAHAALTAAGGKIAAAAGLYPVCETSPSYYSPLFDAIGSADDWDSPAVCESLTNFPSVSGTPVDVSGYGALFRILVYPNATHAFDVQGPTTIQVNQYGYHIAYNPTDASDVQQRIKTFFDTYVR